MSCFARRLSYLEGFLSPCASDIDTASKGAWIGLSSREMGTSGWQIVPRALYFVQNAWNLVTLPIHAVLLERMEVCFPEEGV